MTNPEPSPTVVPRTDFSLHSHEELVRMLAAGRPAGVYQAGDTWHGLGRGLHERADDIDRQLTHFSPLWSGGAADQYRAMMRDLVAGIRTVADTALSYRDLVHQSGDSLTQAQARMPSPVAISPVDATIAALAAGTLPAVAATALWDSVGVAGRATLVQQVQQVQQQTAVAGDARANAVQVMTTLAGNYVVTEQTIKPIPDAAAPPATPPAQTGTTSDPIGSATSTAPVTSTATLPDTSTTTTTGLPATTTTTTTPPLFSGVYTAGAVAAGAAAAGLFKGAAGKLRDKLKSKNSKTKSEAVAAGAVGGIAGGAVAAATPIGSPDLASAGAAAGAAGVTAGAAGAATSSAARGMGMPMMPMGGMGDTGGAGGGRRIPPWLVETEDVWGESVVVTPPVIGATPMPRGRA